MRNVLKLLLNTVFLFAICIVVGSVVYFALNHVFTDEISSDSLWYSSTNKEIFQQDLALLNTVQAIPYREADSFQYQGEGQRDIERLILAKDYLMIRDSNSDDLSWIVDIVSKDSVTSLNVYRESQSGVLTIEIRGKNEK